MFFLVEWFGFGFGLLIIWVWVNYFVLFGILLIDVEEVVESVDNVFEVFGSLDVGFL